MGPPNLNTKSLIATGTGSDNQSVLSTCPKIYMKWMAGFTVLHFGPHRQYMY